jgi:hypothetical protein
MVWDGMIGIRSDHFDLMLKWSCSDLGRELEKVVV